MENARPAPDAFMEALEVELLVRRMDTIVVKREADEQRIHAQYIFEVRHNRDRPSCAHCHRLVPPFFSEDAPRLGERRIVKGELDRWRQSEITELDLAVAGQARPNKVPKGIADFLGVLLADKTERNLRARFTRDDGFRALPRVSANDAVDLGCRPGRHLFDYEAVFLTGRILEPDWSQEFLCRQIECLEIGLDVGWQIFHAAIKAGNGDATFVIPHRTENFSQEPEWILGGAAKNAGMKITISADNLDVFVNEASQRGGHGRRLLIPHGRIANKRQVHFELSRIVANKPEQILGAAFLFALYHHGDRQWQLASNDFECAAGLNERHRLAFVVACATRDYDLAPIRQRFNARLERRRLPKIQRIDRLDVVVPVKQHSRACSAVRLANHDWVAGRRTHGRLKSD